ncbi:hypothetical protein [Pseudanabaena galeata]|uniref:hypothetical protein n=1 Tax=Pseudanabaena galeata TaxID=1112103 RepID=UPI00247943AF|nr:hypothetical protein [Pseudanabaena galeata]WGS74073.1 hypothetical protein OA858_08610 [Pseudanabaena galeata CCNP1313]
MGATGRSAVSDVLLCAFVAVRSPLLDHFKNSRAIARQQHRLGREATISLGFWALDRNFIQCDRLMVLVEID